MTVARRFAVVVLVLAALAVVGTSPSLAGAPQRHVVGESDIQARIDRQVGQADADRQAIQTLLSRPAVRRIAGTAGLSLERASAAAANLSGADLANLAAQAKEVDSQLAGGTDTIVISATTLIIILLLLILLTR